MNRDPFPYFNISRREGRALARIMLRAADIYQEAGLDFDRLGTIMDLTVVHTSCCPLALDELVSAKDSELMHDVAGIIKHFNRETQQLEDGFVPRFATANFVKHHGVQS